MLQKIYGNHLATWWQKLAAIPLISTVFAQAFILVSSTAHNRGRSLPTPADGCKAGYRQGAYSKHLIFVRNLRMGQLAGVFLPDKHHQHIVMKHSSLFGKLVRYEENENEVFEPVQFSAVKLLLSSNPTFLGLKITAIYCRFRLNWRDINYVKIQLCCLITLIP